ncbi:hypothetical protein ERO13_D05G343080v2 [Gossypium hirsutum]|uniref:Uncharacterized protein n=2 Tax=Gossypium TaxID=3633 RepID=A0A5J5RMB7_GOSBA|nr:hypothetical protein ES319_D05G374300v1 [Gossypium barbadense]KAG4149587.1 hypothetical protein ERO13_D05G343080v2 [Gossypium hirsutum]TYG71483.1 hypothetical protein ES288_D05G400500v1 [Gossypium darwinii]
MLFFPRIQLRLNWISSKPYYPAFDTPLNRSSFVASLHFNIRHSVKHRT